MSTTVRVSRKDKAALEGLQRRLGTKTMAETIRMAISFAEAGDDKFIGDVGALREAIAASRTSGSRNAKVSEHVDEEIAAALLHESKTA